MLKYPYCHQNDHPNPAQRRPGATISIPATLKAAPTPLHIHNSEATLRTPLQVLNLKDNNLENNEIKALVHVLMSSEDDSLQTLDLSNNPISLAGGSAIIDLVTRKPSVVEVRLIGTLIQPKILDKVQEAVAQNRAALALAGQ